MTISELNNKLKNALKRYIKNEGYVDSGKLVKSITFNCQMNGEKLKLKFNAAEYIHYLDDGNLVSNFFGSQEALDIIQEYYVDYSVTEINNSIERGSAS
jgi:hypothetical protein